MLTNKGHEGHSLQQNTTNLNLTTTVLTESISPSWIKTSLHIIGRSYNFTYLFGPGALTLIADGEEIFNLSEQMQKLDIVSFQSTEYMDGMFSSSDGTVMIINVSSLCYYDGLTIHTFYGRKIDPIHNSGRVYHNPDAGTAFYVSDADFITRLERAIAVVPSKNISTITKAVITATDSPNPAIINKFTPEEIRPKVTSSFDSTTSSERTDTTMTEIPSLCDNFIHETSKNTKTSDCNRLMMDKSGRKHGEALMTSSRHHVLSSATTRFKGQQKRRDTSNQSMTKSEENNVEDTTSNVHLTKATVTSTGHTRGKLRSVRLRKPRQSEPHRLHHSTKKVQTSTSNFELTFDNGHINLLHKGEKIIDLSSPEKQTFSHSQTLKLKDNSLKITNSSDHTQTKFNGVKHLITFDGRLMSKHRVEKSFLQVRVLPGQLFVSKDRAFYSSSQQLNVILNDQLARVIPRQSDYMLMFQTIPGGDLLLLINGEPIVTLSDAEVIPVPVTNFIRYKNSTIYVYNVIKQRADKAYPRISQLYVLNGARPRLEKYNQSVSKVLPGGGRLYVHVDSSSAFYSRNNDINAAINEHVNNLSEPPRGLVFSIGYEKSQNTGNYRVVLSVNGGEVFQFNPGDIEDQSLTLKHYLRYFNETLFILQGSSVVDTFINVNELVVFDGLKVKAYSRSAALHLPGGGQVFSSGSRAFYSLSTNLNDQIGEAILAVRHVSKTSSIHSTPSQSTQTPTMSTTVGPQSHTLPLNGIECDDQLNTVTTKGALKVADDSEATKSITRTQRKTTDCSSTYTRPQSHKTD